MKMPLLRVSHVSTFAPTPCGIAHYAGAIVKNLRDVHSQRLRLRYHWEADSSEEVNPGIVIGDVNSFSRLASLANASGCDVVDLQHEFGIWGGTEGEGIFEFLSGCTRPIVATLHTTSTLGRNDRQTRMLRALVERSVRIVVLTEGSKAMIGEITGQSAEKVVVIRHGIPEVSFVGRESESTRNPDDAAQFISPGFFRPDKGIETILDACALLKAEGVDFRYRVIGEPQTQCQPQAAYAERIQRQVRDLRLSDRVEIVTGRFTTPEFLAAIQGADCGVIGYSDMAQNSSGVIPWVLGCGRPVVATPFEYARCTTGVIGGLMVADRPDAASIMRCMRRVVEDLSPIRTHLMPSVYANTRQWLWRYAADRYRATLAEAATRTGVH